MTSAKKKLVLAYPPYSTATSPPLGVCCLKGFVESHLPEWSVKVLDLNLLAHQRFFATLDQRLSQAGPRLPERLTAEVLLARAAETFRGLHREEFFDRPDRCLLYCNVWGQNVYPQLANAEWLEKAYRQAAPMPEHIGQYAEAILREQPDAIGLSICYNDQLWTSLCLARELKRRFAGPILAGGTFFNTGGAEFLSAHPGTVDCIIAGEAEKPLTEFLSGKAPEQISGMICRKGQQVIANPPAWEENLDLLGEPDFSDTPPASYYSPLPVLPVSTSRGCYWRRCAFCAHYKSAGQSYRRRSTPHVIAELTRHVENGVHHFAFIDEMISPAHFTQLADAIAEAGLDISYYAMAKPVKQFDRELLAKIRRSGCRYLLWGVESGSQRLLDLMDKGTKIEEVEQVLQAAREAGVKNHVFVMFDFPTETAAEFQQTIDLLARHQADIAMVHRGLFQLERNSPVFDNPQKFSITRIWQASPVTYRYECSSGQGRPEAQQAFTKNITFLRGFASKWPELGDFWFRDHLLLLYAAT